ncbi:MAG: type II toxin-antitoxin system VapC family toxin [Chloroflexota bacterium]|nr:type II toxin-antitoxin system VapC family toxin [Chloroflexota bacterium]
MYAVGQEHPLREPCRSVLQRIVDGELAVCTDSEVHQEILYRYWSLSRPTQGIALSFNFQGVVNTILPVTSVDITMARELGNRYPHIEPRDWLHLAVMLNNGIAEIISADRHFDDIEGVTRLDPKEFVRAQS